ncbi:MAG TPA: hypothetical protein VEB21_13210, partial [Terriglobales bacterium]|nr:hypothetical protein [Terriglobales bacterium]
AEAHLRAGDPAKALAITETALGLQERIFRSEVWRIRGMAFAQQGAMSDAERCLRAGLELAREQDAQIFALRSAAAVGETLRRLGRASEARVLLSQVCDEAIVARGSVDFEAAERELRLCGAAAP